MSRIGKISVAHCDICNLHFNPQLPPNVQPREPRTQCSGDLIGVGSGFPLQRATTEEELQRAGGNDAWVKTIPNESSPMMAMIACWGHFILSWKRGKDCWIVLDNLVGHIPLSVWLVPSAHRVQIPIVCSPLKAAL